MDKRFFLALILTALVVALTPLLFPTPAAKQGVPAVADSVAATASPASRDTISGAPATATGPLPSTAVAAVGGVPGDSSTAAPPAAPVETTTVTTPKSVYRFSSLGATPVSAVMRDYTVLSTQGKTEQLVELVRAGEQLLSYRLVVPGDTIALDRVPFRLTTGGDAGAGPLTYEAAVAGARVAISYTFAPDSYTVRVRGQVQGIPGPAFLLVGLPSGMRSAEADTVDDARHFAIAYKPVRENASSIPFDKLDPGEARPVEGPLTWAALKNKYFIVGLLTERGDAPFAEMSVVGGARTSEHATNVRATLVEPLSTGAFAFQMYLGPQEWRQLLAQGRDFENVNPYGGFLQAFVQPFATIVMRALLWMHETLRLNYGWVLIFFGVAVRLVLWPLNQRAMQTSLRMQALQPQLQAAQERYKGDPQKMQAAIMQVYKDQGLSPFSPLSGCLPMLLPMPVLITLFFVFQNTIEFRGVPFLWMNDISQHDPYYVLPLLMGASAYALSWIGLRSAPANPQAKLMSYMFPAMMLIFFYRAAAGLNLYYAVQNVAALPQQWLIARQRAKMPATVSGPIQGPGTKKASPRAPSKSRR